MAKGGRESLRPSYGRPKFQSDKVHPCDIDNVTMLHAEEIYEIILKLPFDNNIVS